MSITATEKQLIVKQLDYDSARLETLAAYFNDGRNDCMAMLVDEIIDRLHASASIIEAHVEVTS